METNETILGIDLGTTNSVVSILRDGVPEVLREGDRLGDQRDSMVQALEKLSASKESHQEELLVLENAHNKYYEQATQKMKQFLATLDEARLAERARRTLEPDDDELVREITHLGSQLEQTRNQTTSLTRERQVLAERLRGLQHLLVQFQSAEFDSRRSLFAAGFQLESHLARYLEGEESGPQVWKAIRLHQQVCHRFTDKALDHTG